jgi:hypothetical protein
MKKQNTRFLGGYNKVTLLTWAVAVLALIQAGVIYVLVGYMYGNWHQARSFADFDGIQMVTQARASIYTRSLVVDSSAKTMHMPELGIGLPYDDGLRDLRYLVSYDTEDTAKPSAIDMTMTSLMGNASTSGSLGARLNDCFVMATLYVGQKPAQTPAHMAFFATKQLRDGSTVHLYENTSQCAAVWGEEHTSKWLVNVLRSVESR